MKGGYNMLYEYDGKYPEIDDSVFIAPNAVITGDVKIAKDASIWYGTVIRGDVSQLLSENIQMFRIYAASINHRMHRLSLKRM